MDTLRYELRDGGRRQCGHSYERNDCTVRALAIFASMPYDTAHRIAREAGRKLRRGFRTATLLKHAEKYGVQSNMAALPKGKRMRVGTFIDRHPEGRFIVRMRKHAFAVIDGKIFDMDRDTVTANCIVTHFWGM